MNLCPVKTCDDINSIFSIFYIFSILYIIVENVENLENVKNRYLGLGFVSAIKDIMISQLLFKKSCSCCLKQEDCVSCFSCFQNLMSSH